MTYQQHILKIVLETEKIKGLCLLNKGFCWLYQALLNMSVSPRLKGFIIKSHPKMPVFWQ